MSYKIFRSENFSKQLKKLAKKYTSIKNDYFNLLDSLKVDPQIGSPLGNNCYKVRMQINSKKQGKSGGARVITYVLIEESKITLLDIYDKSEKDSISEKELKVLIKKAGS
jgi:mRNA-degrading endonuclease RelE of RelBE toxin-antitoxin system